MELPVVLFDGVCNLCNSSVQFIIRHDKKKQFRFASLQSEAGQALLKKHGLSPTELNSFVLVDDGAVYTHSTGALRMLKKMGSGWSVLSAFLIVPRFIRDGVYKMIARNRYKWFGKKASCWIPTPDLKSRFLD